MSKQHIQSIIEKCATQDGLTQTGIKGVQFFRATTSIPCAPAIYEPSIIAIVSGTKEAIFDGKHYVYDSQHYLCCPTTMPVEAGTPLSSKDNPLLGIYISLDTRMMGELALKMHNHGSTFTKPDNAVSGGLALAQWDDIFTQALLRLVELANKPAEIAILGDGRLAELYYAILNGEAADLARGAFGVGNEIARAITYAASKLDTHVTIDELAELVGMSRAVFHRRFKQTTSMSPIQFVKSMRLNNAAMKIADGEPVSKAALDVGYVSSSQFSREFKRAYGQSPKQWSQTERAPHPISAA